MSPKHLLTTVGTMNIARRYYACRDCHATHTPWDRWAGLGDDGHQITEQARKVVVAVGTAWSFDRSSVKLKDLCNITVSDDTIKRVCQSEGERVRQWLNRALEPVAAFAAQPGRPEFYSNGLKINTTGGWTSASSEPVKFRVIRLSPWTSTPVQTRRGLFSSSRC